MSKLILVFLSQALFAMHQSGEQIKHINQYLIGSGVIL